MDIYIFVGLYYYKINNRRFSPYYKEEPLNEEAA